MANVCLKELLDEVCDWCLFAYCSDDCGVKAIANYYKTETLVTDIKEVK